MEAAASGGTNAFLPQQKLCGKMTGIKWQYAVFCILLLSYSSFANEHELDENMGKAGFVHPQYDQHHDDGVVDEATQDKLFEKIAEEMMKRKIEELRKAQNIIDSPGLEPQRMPWPVEEPSLEQHQENAKKFIEWLANYSTELGPIELKVAEKMKGVFATEQISNGTLILKIPRLLLFSTENLVRSDMMRRWPLEQLQYWVEKRIDSTRAPKVFLALYLIHEMRKAYLESEVTSFYKPWFEILPYKYDQPLTWSEEHLRLLQASPVRKAVADVKDVLNEDYNKLVDLFQHPRQGFTPNMYHWAMLTVSTYIQSFPELIEEESKESDGEEDAPKETTETKKPTSRMKIIYAMIPVIDQMNREIAHNTSLLSLNFLNATKMGEKGRNKIVEFRFNSDQVIEKGKEFRLFNPDCVTNICYLLNHGFIPETNPFDGLPLTIINFETNEDNERVPSLAHRDHWVSYCTTADCLDETHEKEKFSILEKHNLNQVVLGQNDADLIAAAKIILLDPADLKKPGTIEKILKGKRVNTQLSANVHQALLVLLESTLAAYETSADQDTQLLHDSSLHPHARLAIRMRLSEKKIFLSLIELVKQKHSSGKL